MSFKKEQQVQDDFYEFPYHYVVNFRDTFSMFHIYDWGLNYASASEFLIKKIEETNKNNSIIDIGCGDGKLTRELALHFTESKVAGVDYSERPISLAKALNFGSKIDFLTANLIKEKLLNQYSTATLMEVYEHIEPNDADDFLKGVQATLETGGILHLTVPHKNIPVTPHHFRHFTVEILVKELEKYFEIIEVIPFEKISKKRKWLLRCFANKYFLLSNKKWRNKLYSYYKRKLFFVKSEKDAQRIYVQCKKKD